MGILISLTVIFFSCLFIWRACDGFELASEYIGRNLSEGVRGATINAISSSLPELFTTLIALFVFSDADGFAVGIGTTAGSALFNGMIIPALCILFVVGKVIVGRRVDTVDVSSKVILRDGIALIAGEILLIYILMGTLLDWWQGLTLMLFYGAYVWYMLSSMSSKGKYSRGIKARHGHPESEATSNRSKTMMASFIYWLSLGPVLDLKSHFIKARHREQMMNHTWNGWPLLLASVAVIGAACWLLVKGCEWLGTGGGNELHPHYELFGAQFVGLGIPSIFVAVIFAAMATSVPDTIISIRDARDGDYDDAVANALGSNIFDICFALGFPLFVYTLLYGPIEMKPTVIQESAELRISLLILTIVSFFLFLFGRNGRDSKGNRVIKLKRFNAYMLLALYGIFLVYVIGRSINTGWALSVAEYLQWILSILH